MAEVRKKVVEDKYNTSSIKIKSKENETKKTKSNTKKSTNIKSTEKKGFIAKFRIFCNGVKGEFKKVHWTSKKDMVKYSIATIVFVIFCAGFFYLIDVIFALIQSLFH